MPRSRRRKTTKALRKTTIRLVVRQLQLVLLLLAVVLIALTIFTAWRREPALPPADTPTPSVTGTGRASSPSPEPTPTHAEPTPSPTPQPRRVGILAGHSGPHNDPGAVCPDGLREVDINLAVAKRVVAALEDSGYEVDLLEEHDDRLYGYVADALLSIHADSCDIPDATGFKVARVSISAIPQIEDILVECLYKEYQRGTGLQRHDFSITPGMHQYYAFLKIHPETPGAIIELGFMAADRDILVNEPDRLADGIVAGLLCFLDRASAP
jgi:N-acetylmuramoyl-L-alanine amidase